MWKRQRDVRMVLTDMSAMVGFPFLTVGGRSFEWWWSLGQRYRYIHSR